MICLEDFGETPKLCREPHATEHRIAPAAKNTSL
jgi:hypothetical protein